MGHGYSACTTTGISKEFLDRHFIELITEIENHPEFETWGQLAQDINDISSVTGDSVPNLRSLFVRLQKEFELFTTVQGKGLTLSLIHYDSNNGERYDDVENTDDCIFAVDGVYSRTPAGKWFESDLQEMSWAVFG